MKLKRLIVSAAAALLGLAGAPAEARETPPAGAVPGPALWRVTDADTTIYLFGTVHALPQGKEWFDARIERAFAASDEMVTEVDLSDQAASTAAANARSIRASNHSLPSGSAWTVPNR